jgi:hypothetical protein
MPSKTARAAGLNDAEASSLVGADHIGLVMAAASFHAKRERRKSRHRLLLWRKR